MELRYFVIGSWIHRWPRVFWKLQQILFTFYCTIYIVQAFFLKQHKITITFKKIHLSKLLAYYILK